MRRSFVATFDMLTTCDRDPLPRCAGRSVRLPLLNWTCASLLAASIAILAVLTIEPEQRDQTAPCWSHATGHSQGIWALAITSEGQRLATGGNDRAVVIWEVGKGALSELSSDLPLRVQCLAFSPDGATLAAGYDGDKVVLWNVATGARRATFHGHPNQFQCLAFSPDGRTLASGGAESIIIWDVETRRTRSALLGRYGMVSALRFAPGGQALASGYTNGMVRLWDLANGKCQELMGSNLENHSILGVAFSPDGLMLAAGSMTRGTRLWNVATSQESAMFQNEDENVLQVAFSSNGQMLIEVTHGQIVRLRDVATGSTRTLLRASGQYCLAFTPDARFLVSGGDDSIVRVWDLARVDCGN
jgi:WD40 repeat protein